MTPDPQDSTLAVRFFTREIQNGYQSNAQGRPIFETLDYIRIEVPGDRHTVIEEPVEQRHKDRFPLQWAQFQNNRQEQAYQGTPLKEWSLLTASQALELRHFKFYTVEQVAAASDAQVNQLGMIVGMGGHAFREKAKAYLAKASGDAIVSQQAEELSRRDQQIADLQAQLAEINKAILAQKAKPAKKETAEA